MSMITINQNLVDFTRKRLHWFLRVCSSCLKSRHIFIVLCLSLGRQMYICEVLLRKRESSYYRSSLFRFLSLIFVSIRICSHARGSDLSWRSRTDLAWCHSWRPAPALPYACSSGRRASSASSDRRWPPLRDTNKSGGFPISFLTLTKMPSSKKKQQQQKTAPHYVQMIMQGISRRTSSISKE